MQGTSNEVRYLVQSAYSLLQDEYSTTLNSMISPIEQCIVRLEKSASDKVHSVRLKWEALKNEFHHFPRNTGLLRERILEFSKEVMVSFGGESRVEHPSFSQTLLSKSIRPNNFFPGPLSSPRKVLFNSSMQRSFTGNTMPSSQHAPFRFTLPLIQNQPSALIKNTNPEGSTSTVNNGKRERDPSNASTELSVSKKQRTDFETITTNLSKDLKTNQPFFDDLKELQFLLSLFMSLLTDEEIARKNYPEFNLVNAHEYCKKLNEPIKETDALTPVLLKNQLLLQWLKTNFPEDKYSLAYFDERIHEIMRKCSQMRENAILYFKNAAEKFPTSYGKEGSVASRILSKLIQSLQQQEQYKNDMKLMFSIIESQKCSESYITDPYRCLYASAMLDRLATRLEISLKKFKESSSISSLSELIVEIKLIHEFCNLVLLEIQKNPQGPQTTHSTTNTNEK